jgi:hypothetical protein
MNKAFTPRPQAHQSSHPIGSPYSVSEAFPLSPYQADIFNERTAKSVQKPPAKSIGQNSPQEGAREAPPLNILGGGSHRFPGSRAVKRTTKVAAIVDAELGVPAGSPIISRDGVVTFRIPRRRT